MSRESRLFVLGVLTLLAPYLGLPYAWLMVMLPILGILIIITALALRARRPKPLPHAPKMHEEEHPAAHL